LCVVLTAHAGEAFDRLRARVGSGHIRGCRFRFATRDARRFRSGGHRDGSVDGNSIDPGGKLDAVGILPARRRAFFRRDNINITLSPDSHLDGCRGHARKRQGLVDAGVAVGQIDVPL